MRRRPEPAIVAYPPAPLVGNRAHRSQGAAAGLPPVRGN